MHTIRILVLASILVIILINPLEAYTAYATMPTAQNLSKPGLPHDMLLDPEILLTTVDDQVMFAFDGVIYLLKPSQYQLSYWAAEEGLFPVWIVLIHSLNNEGRDKSVAQNFVDPVFGFSFTILSQSMDELLSSKIPFSIPSKIPMVLARVGINFKLTDQVLKKLKDERIPEELLEELIFLQDQGFSGEDAFLNALEGQVGKEGTERHQQLILEHALVEGSISRAQTSQNMNLYIVSDPTNIESWDPLLYQFRRMRKVLAKDNVKIKNRSKVPLDEQDDSIFDIMKFFKKWGVPTPIAVVLCIVGVYLILAFLTRNK